ncbi:MAG: hypothetical protein ACTSVI_07715 [Promethearchaeota archaeon]
MNLSRKKERLTRYNKLIGMITNWKKRKKKEQIKSENLGKQTLTGSLIQEKIPSCIIP